MRRPWEDIEQFGPCCVALGLFDGVHRGHQQILTRTLQLARASQIPSVVFSFENHPLTVLGQGKVPSPRLLVTPGRRKELIRLLGIDHVLMPEFTWAWAETTAEEFMEGFLCNWLHARQTVVGYNYRFGKGAKGTPGDLVLSGSQLGFRTEIIPAFKFMSQEVSSTRIRKAILHGDLDLARDLLGRPHELPGLVIEGQKRGRTLGFPTANLEPDLPPLVSPGVYVVKVNPDGWEGLAPTAGMLFIGTIQSFEEARGRASVEVHLLDYEGDLYGKRLRLEIHARIRDIEKFSSPQDLIERLAKDKEICKNYFNNRQTL